MNNWKKVFAILWSGQLVSILTSAIVNYAVVFWLSLRTGSAEVLAFATIAALLPQALLGFVAGVYVDRWKRKTVMIAADSFIALCTVALALLLKSGNTELFYIYILLALRSVGSAFHMPAMQASIPLLAPESQLLRIAGVNQMIESASTIAGPALGAFCITIMDISYVLMLDVIGAVAGCGTLLLIRIPNPDKSERKTGGLWKEMVHGFRLIVSTRGLNMLFLISVLATFFIMPVSVLFPLMTLNHFGGGAFHMSLVEIIWGVGTLAGGAVLGVMKFKTSKIVLINVSYLVIGCGFMLSGFLHPGAFYWFVGFTACCGIAGAMYNASFTAVLQQEIDPGLLGRVFSNYFSLSLLPAMIGLLGTGFLAEEVGISATFVIMGILLMLCGAVSFAIPALMSLGKSSGVATAAEEKY